MPKEIIINVEKKETRIAILDGGELVEFYLEGSENTRTLGDIYLCRVQRKVPSVRAAFVDIGQAQSAYLHFTDLDRQLAAQLKYAALEAPHLEANPPDFPKSGGKGSRQPKHGSPDLIKEGQRILVQVIKEPYSTKGSRVTTRLSLAGRFLVLLPLSRQVSVSRKIASQKERRRLRKVVRNLLPPGFGVIVRTVALNKDEASIETDLKLLLKRWRKMETRVAQTEIVPRRVHTDVSKVSSIVRDLFSNDYERILIDNERTYQNTKRYVHAVAPHMAGAVKLYRGDAPIFKSTRLQKKIDEVFESNVQLPSGGYLVLEETEAMHVIDVNSGSSRRTRSMDYDERMLKVNLEAVQAVARQLRLRDLGGIIVVDFIDLRDPDHRDQVYQAMVKALEEDRAPCKALPISQIGLMQITRKRTGPGIRVQNQSKPRQHAQKTYGSPRDLVASMEAWLGSQRNGSAQKLRLHVHPFTAAYLSRGLVNLLRRWRLRHRVHITIREVPRMSVMNYRFEALDGEHRNGAPSKQKAKEKART